MYAAVAVAVGQRKSSPDGATTISVGLLNGPAARSTRPPSLQLHPVSDGFCHALR